MNPVSRIRQAKRSDLQEIVEMLADDELGQRRESADLPLNGGYVRAFEQITADPHQVLIVAEVDGHAVGTLQITIIPGISRNGMTRGQLEAIRVAKQHRGKGIGEKMVRWAIDECKRHGCGLVQLTSDKKRNKAHRFYVAMGFVASHEGLKLNL